MPVNSINAVVQDRTGYIWIATFDGLARFDGVRFTIFNSANSPGLPSNRIVRLQEGPNGTLWLATAQGEVVRFRDGQFTNIPFQRSSPDDQISNFLVDSATGVWFGNGDGLWRTRGDTLVRFAPDLIHDPVKAILRRRDGSVWVAASQGGLFRIGRGQLVTKVPIDRSLTPNNISRIHEDSHGTLWLSTERELWALGDQLIEVKASGRSVDAAVISEVASTKTVYVQTARGVYRVDEHGATPIGLGAPFISQSLSVWSDGNALWSVSGHDVYRGNTRVYTIPNSAAITAALFDREGSLWLATDGGGLHFLKPALFTTYPAASGADAANVYLTYADNTGGIWFSETGNPGVKRIDAATERIEAFGLAAGVGIAAMAEDEDGHIWLGGLGGLYMCDQPPRECRPAGPPAARRAEIYSLYKDAHFNIWVGAAGRIYQLAGSRWTAFGDSAGAPAATARAFAETPDGALWIGTTDGLARYANGRFTRVTAADGLPSNLIRSLYLDADGWLWVGTEGRGLARLDYRDFADTAPAKKRAIVRIGTDDGLFDEVIHCILEDETGRLWMNTNRGIFWVPRRELIAFADGKIARVHSTAYSEHDGLRNREGNGGVFPDGAKSRDGRLWFPTQDGVAAVNPADVGVKRQAPSVAVEGIVANSRSMSPHGDSIAITPNQRDAQIQYTALTFLEPANVRFRYRLLDYDRDWVDAGSRRVAFYTKLPPGHYTFRVEASEAGGGWSEPGATLEIRVLPQLWETVAFRWATIAALVLAAFGAVRLRDRRLRDRALELEKVVGERTATLRVRERELAERNLELQSLDEAKTRFFANVSHELRTPLTLTIGPLEDVRARSSGDPAVDRWLDIALRNSRRLLRLVDQLLDVAKLDAHAMRLELRQMDLAPFTRGIVAAFSPVAEQKRIRLTMVAPESLSGSFDADAIEKILTNLLSNAVKFTPTDGEIVVTLTRDGGVARWQVRDTGPGIPADAIGQVFERFYRVDETASRTQPGTGIGLSLVKELAELHGGGVAVESNEYGTTFTATVPIGAVADGAATSNDAPSLIAELVVTQDHGTRAANDDDVADDVPTLLIVDDSADLRSYIRDHFASRFKILEAEDGAAGIELARRNLPDVVISDVMMPGTDGHELVRTLRESRETDFLSIILLTAQAGDQQRLAGLERGADDYMVKPFEMRELDARVRNLIASRRRLRDRFAASAPLTPTLGTMAAADSKAASGEEAAYAARVREAIRGRLSDPEFGVSELAAALAQDRTNLFRRVRQTFGESPSELLRRMRLEEAARLLRTESSTVTAIAYAVGFNSVSYFCRVFLEEYGTTAVAYRESNVNDVASR